MNGAAECFLFFKSEEALLSRLDRCTIFETKLELSLCDELVQSRVQIQLSVNWYRDVIAVKELKQKKGKELV